MSRKSTDGAPQLHKTIADLLEDEAEVLSKGPQVDLEIKDRDETTTKEDVPEALKEAAGEEHKIGADTIKSLRKAYGGTQTASVTLAATTAKKILGEHVKIKIGWVNCRIRRVEIPMKYFRCWHHGHLATKCRSKIDRSKLCAKCSDADHKPTDCKKEPRCALCTAKATRRTMPTLLVAPDARCIRRHYRS
ncbi:uncharacterized protein LOC107041860 [Diachasma alloeum]|uniref:uncharacterized protein LOC107041860 n=1 Tax=Diachasma alloeum TaxID=454923 RepID=UPI0007384058|nr:uncharacterized protein LOC107041860 [Diachasma alloeum]